MNKAKQGVELLIEEYIEEYEAEKNEDKKDVLTKVISDLQLLTASLL